MAVSETGNSERVYGMYRNLKGSQWNWREEIGEMYNERPD